MRFGPYAYLAIFAGSTFTSLALTPLVLRLAVRVKALDQPGGHKTHVSPVPYLGGLAIVVAFCAATAAAALFVPLGPRAATQLMTIVATAMGLAVVGLIDDLRGLPVWLRLAAQGLGATALWFTGVKIDLAGGDAIDFVLTVLWILGITNAFNLLDNMDGLSAGVAGLAAAFFFLLAAVSGQFLVAALSLALLGCAIGFLRHNIHPARIYMGDAGSLFFGVLLAVVGLKLRFDAPHELSVLVPILVLGVAIFDTTLVTITRIGHRRSPLAGGADHTSHRLVFVGIPVRAAVGLIYAAGIALGWTALVVARIDLVSGWILGALVIGVGAFVGLLLGRVPVYENSRRGRLVLQAVRDHDEELRESHAIELAQDEPA